MLSFSLYVCSFTLFLWAEPNLENYSSAQYWPKRALFSEKKRTAEILPPPIQSLFLRVLHQNKTLHNFQKGEQCSIVRQRSRLGPDESSLGPLNQGEMTHLPLLRTLHFPLFFFFFLLIWPFWTFSLKKNDSLTHFSCTSLLWKH